MYKPTKHSKGGSETVEAEKFGDRITCDHLVTQSVEEESIDGDRVALVFKDVATNFRWIYPSAAGSAEECLNAFRRFTRPDDKVGMSYSDKAPQLKAACDKMGWRQNTSIPYELERLLDECGLGPDEGEVEVMDANAGKMEFIPKDDPSYYDSSGYKGRRYKGSKKPDSIPTHVWRAASRAQREKARSKAELEEALEKHKSAVASFNSAKAAISARLSHANSVDNKGAEAIPAMPVFPNSSSKHEGTRVHRDKLAEHHEYAYGFIMNAFVSRPVGQKEINNNPAAQAALDKEWNNLVTKGAWDYKTVREWKDVSDEAIKSKTKVHVGKVFEICVEKGSELPEGNPLRKFKGRTVFQGNNVNESSDVALFAELGSSPANMEAGKSLDAYGSMPGNRISQGDG